MKPIDWLLARLDEPGVSEIVLGIGRPVAVRTPEGFRPITSMDFERKDIETLVAGTPMSGLIGSPTSLPPVEMQVEGRRLLVEVVRQGIDAALRIALVAPAPSRTATKTASPPPAAPPDDEPIVSVRITGTTRPPRTVTATSSPPPTVPSEDAAIAPVRSGAPTIPPRNSTPTAPPRTRTPTTQPRSIPGSTPPLTHVPVSTATMPLMAHGPAPVDEVTPPPPELDLAYAATLGGGGELVEDQGEIYAPDWYGPQIIDEHTDITAVHVLLEAAYRRNASDLHIIASQPITIRRLGLLAPLDVNALKPPVDRTVYSALLGPLDPLRAERFLLPLLGPSARQRLAEVGYVDFGFPVPGRSRVRANISQQQDGLAGTFRLCRDTIPTLDGLGLPRELEKIVRHHQGLVVVAGPSGHGKTTTMAALVDLLNASNSDHIITIEDPVEIEHPAKRAIVSHREVGRHTLSFISALKSSLREDPDVIVIGELRDRETVEIALAAAETGHLVLSTISTPSAVKTIDRLIDMFPPDDQVQVRASISGTLRAVIAQRLLPNAARDGMVAAIELVTGVLPLATMIRDNKLYQLPSLLQRGRAFGMIRLDDSLAEHVRAKRITEEVALAAAENKRDLAAVLASRSPRTTTNVGGLFGGKGSS